MSDWMHDWHHAQAERDYRLDSERDTGSPLPAIIWLALFCAGVWIGIWGLV